MINLETNTPREYSEQSRDYQVFVFVYNAIFNYVKMYADLFTNIWTDNIDDELLDLRAYTLNFIRKFDWNNDDLRGVTNCFRYLLRTKGTKGAISMALQILSRIKGIKLVDPDHAVEEIESGLIRLLVSEDVEDLGNLEDLLRYILPAGILYEVVKYAEINSDTETKIVIDHKLTSEGVYTSDKIVITNSSTDTPATNPIPRHNTGGTSIVNYDTGLIITDGSNNEGGFPHD